MTAAVRPDRNSWSGLRSAVMVVGAIGILYLARATFIPLAFAITLALILSPLVGWLRKRGLHRVLAAFLVMTMGLVAVSGVGYVIVNQLVEVVNGLPTYRATISKKVQAFRKPQAGAISRAAENVKELGKELASPATSSPGVAGRFRAYQSPVPVQITDGPDNAFTSLREAVEPLLAPIGMFGIVMVFTIFLLVEESDLRNRLLRLAGVDRLNLMTQALEDATRRVSRYLFLQFLVNAVFGLLCGLGLYWIGVPYAALWGAVAALLRIVPYVGSIVAGLLPLILCLAVFDGWRQPALVFVMFFALEMVTGNFVEPLLYGAHTGISSLALLLTTVFWATLWGPSGLILSTPLTVCVVVLGRHIKQLSFLHILLGDEPVLTEDAQLYQRLLAMDDHEARHVVDHYRREKTLVDLYDQVFLPAIGMAEQDRHKGALSPDREEFFFLSMREMLSEQSSPTESPKDDGGRVFCIPASDEADELAAGMLSQLLEQVNRASISLPLGIPANEMLELLKPSKLDVFCISAVPPFAFTSARNLARQLRTRYPKTPLLIGIWGFSGDLETATGRFKPLVPDKCVATLQGALDYLASSSAPEADSQPQPVAAIER